VIPEIEFLLNKAPFGTGIEFHVFSKSDDGVYRVLKSELMMEEHKPFEVLPKAQIRLSTMKAQKLMDDLWDCGIRPSEGSGSAGAMAATERHLEDMRSLVFKTTKKGER
jgi:hypothetical protein